ncbi:hypothetical protein [Chryseobacterium sp.]|uniref:hypothetical protein n=1 Tax=Chryseobacterium sp. TaxID=1871047 RepID=UPI0028990F79|nr:hypothetical protein [Chryseobacterium sp.]
MENQEKQQTEKITKEEFFKQMKILLEAAPKEVTFSVVALENMESHSDAKEGIVSVQGSPLNLTFAFSEAFRRSREIKEVVFEAVEFFKFYSMPSPSSILQDILRSRPFR